MSTPMMEQYQSIKRNHSDAILFFRLGDFYEMFQSDAREASSLLGLTLTKRNGVPMCGIPCHAAQSYIAKLLRAGKKIAVCEQTRLPQDSRELAVREVVEIITPGTVIEDNLLDRGANNYVLALAAFGAIYAVAAVDVSTADFRATSCSADAAEFLRRELTRLAPKEILVQESLYEIEFVRKILEERRESLIQRIPDWSFDRQAAHERLCRHFGTANLKAFALSESSPELAVAGILLEYLEDVSKSMVPHLGSIRLYRDGDFIAMDESTMRNLELTKNLNDGSPRYTLLSVLDSTRTAMGQRTLRRWILEPLTDVTAINERLDAVEGLYRDQKRLARLRQRLSGVLDLERLAARCALDKAHAKDLLGIKTSIAEALGAIDEAANALDSDAAVGLVELADVLERAVHEEPSTLLSEGNIIRRGYSSELDGLHDLRENSRRILEEYLEEERRATGIPTLRIRHNQIIGHFLEVTKSHLERVPPHFIRRQSMVGAERFTTERLAELETRLDGLSERVVELERALFIEVRDRVKERLVSLQKLSVRVAELDCLQSFAQAATVHGYTRPVVNEGRGLSIVRGRHPVVEAHLPAGEFVPNSLDLDGERTTFALITGPNMAGKSTFLRQTALIALMAQIGSFVSAEAVEMGVVDSIFCRVGSSDNIARGESTFLVEMNETAYILRTAGERSLVIMDEVGRGTGTRDGLAIAQAVSEHLLAVVRAKTLFATHFHELTSLSSPGLVNLSMEVVEKAGEIVFLKRVKPGPSNNSYGLHVARLAGLPDQVVRRAHSVLRGLPTGGGRPVQPELFVTDPQPCGLLRELADLDIDGLKPLEALNLLAEFKRRVRRA